MQNPEALNNETNGDAATGIRPAVCNSKPPGPDHEPIDSPVLLSSDWARRIDRARQQAVAPCCPVRVVPVNVKYYAEEIHLVENATTAAAMLEVARQRPLSYVAIDTEFSYGSPGILMKKNPDRDFRWHDPRSVLPLLLAVVLVEAKGSSATAYQFAVDMRSEAARPALQQLLEMRLPFVGHYLQAELCCLWQLGLPTPSITWDTWVAEKSFCLGLHHARYSRQEPDNAPNDSRASTGVEDSEQFRLSLVFTCLRRDVYHAFAPEKMRLQQAFLNHPLDKAFSQEQIHYALSDALAAAELYPIQVQLAVNSGCLRHLETIEMPWAVTNSRMIWDGIRVDPGRIADLKAACQQHVSSLEAELAAQGLENVLSSKQVHKLMDRLGLLQCFQKGQKYTFDDKHLEAAENQHPVIAQIRTLRKVKRLLSDQLLTGQLVGADGRLHPDHRQLGSHSGRNSMRWPNIGGVGRALRPLVVPEPGNAIGEVDLSQIEVGIAAAFYGDLTLINMFNSCDVYSAMARQFFTTDLDEQAKKLPDEEFKRRFRLLRDRMKVYTLGIIYGITPHGLSVQLNITPRQATGERERFLGMFPDLAAALEEASAYGVLRGFAYICSGLRRYRAESGSASQWESNWLRNTPVQGSAGVVFKVAGNRLRLRYQHWGAKLILPLHDAFIFECPRQHLERVAKTTAEVMRSTVQEYFSGLDPHVDINIDHPDCWNKDGKHRSLRLWMLNPEWAWR